MAWSNKSDRERLSVEKSHSLSLSVRVEDRLHRDIIKSSDQLWFTVRPDSYMIGKVDTDAAVAVTGVQIDTDHGKVFMINVQAEELNLDPELEWFYDVTYVADNYSVSLVSGELEVAANVTNRGAGSIFVGGQGVFGMVATVQDRALLSVTNNLPIADKGDAGFSTLFTTAPLSETVGASLTVLASQIDSGGRPLQVGDVLFSTVTKGVLAVVSAITVAGGAVSQVTATTKQVFGLDTLKALLDVHVQPESITVIDTMWYAPKQWVPLPPNYEYHVGDMLFSQASAPGALDKYMVISRVEAITPAALHVQSKIVFPMFADAAALQDMFDAKVSKTQRMNGVLLNATDIIMSADKIPDGTSKVVMSAAERTKLAGIAAGATANQTDATLKARANHTGTQPMSTVSGLELALELRPSSENIAHLWRGTQSQYEQIVTKDPSTLYFIQVG